MLEPSRSLRGVVLPVRLLAVAVLLPGAAAWAQPDPVVTVEAPATAFLGEQVTFSVKFKNAGSEAGYGPYLVLCIPFPGEDQDERGERCDGMAFASAQVTFDSGSLSLTPVGGAAVKLQLPPLSDLRCTDASAVAGDPLCQEPFPLPAGSPGCQLVVLKLPFGSFFPDQPEMDVQVTLDVSDWADFGAPLTISAAGGFQYDDDPDGKKPCRMGAPAQADVEPAVYTVTKVPLSPEGQTASGPNFPRSHELVVDVADRQTVDPLTLTDFLPENAVFLGVSEACEEFVTSGPASGSAGGVLELDFGSVEGGKGAEHQCEIRFFVPDLDADGAPVLEVDRCRAPIENTVEGGGLWNPSDPRDPTPENPDSKVPLPRRTGGGTVVAQCLILLKGMPALVEGHPEVTPGDELEYTLVVEVSDYFQVGDVVIRDLLPDGLELLTTKAVSFSVAGAEPTSGTFVLGNDLFVEVADSPCGDGSTSLELRLSDALSGPGNPQGLLTGGLLDSPQAGATRATIRYRVRVRDGYRCPGAEDDGLVDKHDTFVNDATVQASLWDPDLDQPTAFTVEDPSSSTVAVPGEVVQETVYAHNDTVLGPNDPLPIFAPGDEVTFRIQYLLPSTDAEALLLEKFLPHPAFDVTDQERGLHTASPVRVCPGDPSDPPPLGTLCFQPGPFFDFWKARGLPQPGEDVCTERGYRDLVGPESNGFCVLFGDLEDPGNQPRKIDLLFTVGITDAPFVDGLLLTNEVVEYEEDSSGAASQQEVITQITLGQPDLRLHKGVVGACCPEGEECLLREDPRGRMGSPGSGCEDQFEPPITSTDLAKAGFFESYSDGFRRGDRVRFALVVENHGSSPHGAFNVTVKDVVPPGFAIPAGGADVCVRSGAGGDLPHSGELFGSGLVLTDPGSTQGALDQGTPSPADGSNLAVITYELEVAGLAPGECVDNEASVVRFTGTPEGPNHVRPEGEPSATAQVCHRWDSQKSFVASSESHTRSPAEGVEDMAVGEVVRFRLVTEVPEESHDGFRIVDPLPPGLRYVPGSANVALVSSKDGSLTSSKLGSPQDPWVLGNEATVAGITPDVAFDAPTATFDLGTVSNTDDDCDLELIVIEFVARAVNVPSNQHGTTMANRFLVEIDGGPVSESNVVIVRVVEPKLLLQKRLVASEPGLSATFELTVTNPGPVTAFDLELDDLLPSGVTFVDQVEGPKLKVDPDRRTLALACCEKEEGDPPLCEDGEDERFCALAAGETMVIRFDAQLDDGVRCTSRNHAELTWTSLPGDHGTPLDGIVADTPGTQDGERTGTPTSPGNGPNDHRATAESPVTLPPDLHVTKSHAGEALPGNEVTYTLVVVNRGQGPTTEAVEVVEEIPAGTIYAGGGGPDWQCPFAAAPGPTSVTCVYQGPPLAPGATTELTIRVRLRDGAVSPLVNCAQVHTECDVVEENDRACDETCVGPSHDLELEKDCDLGDDDLSPGPIVEGRFIGCSFAVRNVGCAATEADRSLHVVDTVPAGVRFGPEFPPAAWHCTEAPGELTGCDLDGWVCSFQLVAGGAIDCRYVGQGLGPGEEAPPLVFGFPIQAGEFDLESEPKNCARVSYVGDAFPDNDLGCTSTCPDPTDPGVDYLEIDPGLCPDDSPCPQGRYAVDGCGCRCEPTFTVTAETQSGLLCSREDPVGASVTLTIEGGVGPFACDGHLHPGRTCVFTGMAPGTYEHVVTDQGTGDAKTVEVEVKPPFELTVTSTEAPWPFCQGGTATVEVDGGVPPYTYGWKPSGKSGATVNGLAAGVHEVTVSDGLECFVSKKVTVECGRPWNDVAHVHLLYVSPGFDFAARGLDLALDVGTDGGAGLSLGWEHRFTRRLGLELGLLLSRLDYDAGVEPGDASPGHTETRAEELLLAYGAARIHLLPDRRSDLYLAPLVGYADFGDPPRLQASEELVYGVSVGFDVPLGSGRWGLSGALRYLEGEVDVTAPDLGFSGRADVDLLSTELGMSYRW